jgi:branched-chain amino acid transport system ATP-binding protein
LLEVSELRVKYGDVVAVHKASFRVGEGEIVAIVGSNGAGKTTAVNAISGLIKIESGDIVFQGKNIEGLPSHDIVEKGLIQIPEGRKIFPNLTVQENLRLGSYTPKAKEKRKETMERVFSLFPVLADRGRQRAGSLSGGEQQMLALGRGLMSLPILLMMDEPSLGLAPMFVNQLFEMVAMINDMGTTILLIEQNTANALNCCNRGYVIENGVITIDGTGEGLLRDPHVVEAYLGV